MFKAELQERQTAKLASAIMTMEWHNLKNKPSDDEMLVQYSRFRDAITTPENHTKSLFDFSQEGLINPELALWMTANGLIEEIFNQFKESQTK